MQEPEVVDDMQQSVASRFAIDPESEIRFTPSRARKANLETPPVFIVKPVSARDYARLLDGLTKTMLAAKRDEQSTMQMHSANMQLKACEMGLIGWEYFYGADGEAVEFRRNGAKSHPANLDRLPRDFVQEIAEVVLEGRDISEQASEN